MPIQRKELDLQARIVLVDIALSKHPIVKISNLMDMTGLSRPMAMEVFKVFEKRYPNAITRVPGAGGGFTRTTKQKPVFPCQYREEFDKNTAKLIEMIREARSRWPAE